MEITARLSPADVAAIADAVAERLRGGLPAGSGGTAGPAKLLWTEEQAAEAIGIAPLTLKKWRLAGYIKPTTNVRPILYDRAALEAAAQFVISTRKEDRA
jgi:hypothetical protein